MQIWIPAKNAIAGGIRLLEIDNIKTMQELNVGILLLANRPHQNRYYADLVAFWLQLKAENILCEKENIK